MEKIEEISLVSSKYRFPAQPLKNLIKLTMQHGCPLGLKNEISSNLSEITLN